VSDVYICVRLVVCHLCHRVRNAEDRREGPSRWSSRQLSDWT